MTHPSPLVAKLTWHDPQTGEARRYVLEAGATVTIGRSPNNHICIAERHVSRQHAAIRCQDGQFVLADLDSANGTYVNDQPVEALRPLTDGDVIRLYVPLLIFSTVVSDGEHAYAAASGALIRAAAASYPTLTFRSGPRAGDSIPLLAPVVTIGRAARFALWDISLLDQAISRPHAELHREADGTWRLADLGSANGTWLNDTRLESHAPAALADGDTITLGQTTLLFTANDAPRAD